MFASFGNLGIALPIRLVQPFPMSPVQPAPQATGKFDLRVDADSNFQD